LPSKICRLAAFDPGRAPQQRGQGRRGLHVQRIIADAAGERAADPHEIVACEAGRGEVDARGDAAAAVVILGEDLLAAGRSSRISGSKLREWR
jgi:hypothetical protein